MSCMDSQESSCPETAACESSPTANSSQPSSCSSSSSFSSVLFQSRSGSIVLLDIPRSLEEAQVLPGHWPLPARILSEAPPAEPFHTPEPRDGAAAASLHPHWPQSSAAQVADLMAAAASQSALDDLYSRYSGPFCLPRLCSTTTPSTPSSSSSSSSSSEVPILNTPPRAEYLHGSIQDLRQTFIDTAPRFRLIVLDPPWPNRSARRKTNSYNTVANLAEMRQLLSSIPVPSHLAQDGLVAMWITNKASILEFLTSPGGLFASWGVELVTEWTWLKVTASGEPLFDLESTWRKPWERLLIAKRIGAKIPGSLKPKVIIAVPDMHSRKPNLRGLFQHVLGEEGYPAIEIFARNLTAGWWCWGDEVLRFQSSRHWITADEQPK